MGDIKISLLMYADDIVLLADSEDKLQCMLDTLHRWCQKWRVLINTTKSKAMHFRRGRTQRSDYEFKIGNSVLETVDQYKYLGIIFHEKSDFTSNCEALAKGAGRALGSIISKIHKLKDFGFRSYEKLYNSCVVPILDYCSSVWGLKHYQCIDNVQHRALRYFLGVHRFTPILALYGDSGWIPSSYRRWGNALRYWNRLINMDSDRLTKRVFEFDYRVNRNNWCSDLNQKMNTLGIANNFYTKTCVNLPHTKTLIGDYYADKWSHDIQTVPKLRTYKLFKQAFRCEEYVQMNLNKHERSVLCQFRCGILPLRLETGRYIGERVEERLCRFCTLHSVEDETHFIIHCHLYDDIRLSVLGDTITSEQFNNLTDTQILKLLLNSYPRKVAKFVVRAYLRRKCLIYNM